MNSSWFRSGRLAKRKTTYGRAIAGALLFTFALTVSALAQNHFQSPTPVAGYGPTYDVGVGYSYLSSSIPSAGRVNLNGLDGDARVDFFPHWGITADAGYVRTSDVLNTGHNGYVLTFLGGPVFYPFGHHHTHIFIHGLAGAGLVDSAVPVSGTQYLHGWVERPSYAFGGGFERSIFGPFAVRLTGDYLRTAFANSAGQVALQNNLRVTASFVLRLREHPSAGR